MIPSANLIELNADIMEVHIPSWHCLPNCCRAFCELARPHRSPWTQWREQPVAWWLSQFPPPCQNTKQKQSKPCFYSLQADSRNHCCVTSAVLETVVMKKNKEKQRTALWFDSCYFHFTRRDDAQTFPKESEHFGVLSLRTWTRVWDSDELSLLHSTEG